MTTKAFLSVWLLGAACLLAGCGSGQKQPPAKAITKPKAPAPDPGPGESRKILKTTPEYAAADACFTYRKAQSDYRDEERLPGAGKVYAFGIRGQVNAKDHSGTGLYTTGPKEGEPGLVSKEFAMAEDVPAQPKTPMGGYFFRILHRKAGMFQDEPKTYWAVVAYPAEYGVSGKLTFMMD